MWCVIWQPLYSGRLERVYDDKYKALKFIEGGKKYDPDTKYQLYRLEREEITQ